MQARPVDERAACIDDLDACFVACEEAYARLRRGGVAARDSELGTRLLIAAATSMVASEVLADSVDDRTMLLLAVTADACRTCADRCDRDGAHWLAPARDACAAAVAACRSLTRGIAANGE